jgi:hypothetical protein
MDNHETIDSEYQKGFTEGYILARHNRELTEKIAEALKEALGLKKAARNFPKKKMQKKQK